MFFLIFFLIFSNFLACKAYRALRLELPPCLAPKLLVQIERYEDCEYSYKNLKINNYAYEKNYRIYF